MTKPHFEKATEAVNSTCDIPEVLRPEDLQLAHALRTPLTALKSALELLDTTAGSAERERILDIARRNADRMVELLESMLVRGGPARS